jgi:hypothetical protein
METMEELLLVMEGEMDLWVPGTDCGGYGDKLSNLLKRMGWSVSKHWLLASVWGSSQKK